MPREQRIPVNKARPNSSPEPSCPALPRPALPCPALPCPQVSLYACNAFSSAKETIPLSAQLDCYALCGEVRCAALRWACRTWHAVHAVLLPCDIDMDDSFGQPTMPPATASSAPAAAPSALPKCWQGRASSTSASAVARGTGAHGFSRPHAHPAAAIGRPAPSTLQAGARVVNLSFGGMFSQLEFEALERLGEGGTLVVAAGGNEGRLLDAEPTFPAAYRTVTNNILTGGWAGGWWSVGGAHDTGEAGGGRRAEGRVSGVCCPAVRSVPRCRTLHRFTAAVAATPPSVDPVLLLRQRTAAALPPPACRPTALLCSHACSGCDAALRRPGRL
mgnify:CR=1 FL=1